MAGSSNTKTEPSRVLAVSFYYPPANNPRAVQVSRLLEHVNLSTMLICGDDYATDDRIDRAGTLLADDLPHQILRVPFTQPAWKKVSARIANQFHIRLWDKTPDRYRDWKPAVLRALNEHLSGYRPDIIVTFGSPMSDHLIGRELQQKYGVPWIAHFSDPWIENPFKNYSWLSRTVNLSLERDVVEAADRLVYTSSESVDLVMDKYSDRVRQKARVLSHAFDPHLFDSPDMNGRAPIVIRYLGDMYGQRTPAPLFRALESVGQTTPELLQGLQIEFVGSIADFNLSDLGFDELPPGLVTFRPTVPYLESLALMSSADGLLVIDAPATTSVFLPSKLIDYLGAARPVFGITPPGTAANLIQELGGWVADPSQPAAVDSGLQSFVAYLHQRRKALGEPWGDPIVRSRFKADSVACAFEKIVAELV